MIDRLPALLQLHEADPNDADLLFMIASSSLPTKCHRLPILNLFLSTMALETTHFPYYMNWLAKMRELKLLSSRVTLDRLWLALQV